MMGLIIVITLIIDSNDDNFDGCDDVDNDNDSDEELEGNVYHHLIQITIMMGIIIVIILIIDSYDDNFDSYMMMLIMIVIMMMI
jgi:hypothetical protein